MSEEIPRPSRLESERSNEKRLADVLAATYLMTSLLVTAHCEAGLFALVDSS